MTAKLALLMLRFALASLLAGCTDQNNVKRACAHHGGVAAVDWNGFRKIVACHDGAYKIVRW